MKIEYSFLIFVMVIGFCQDSFTQEMIVKDSYNNVLLEVNDEGTMGSITLPDTNTALSSQSNKLYNLNGSLIWNGSALGTVGSAGGWTDGGANVYATSISDKVAIGTTTPEFKLTLDDGGYNDCGIIAKGYFGGGTILTPPGSGSRLIWYSRKAAFRVGYNGSGNTWDDVNIGDASIAMGTAPKASGNSSIAIGVSTTASGNQSAAIGYYNVAGGDYTMALGYYTNADAYCSVATGRYNIGGGSAGTWVDTEPLFEVGNGVDGSTKNNALTVLKNGKVGIGTHTPVSELEVSGRIELPDNDATGIAGSGSIEIGNSLRIDGNEMITDTNTILYMQRDNNGDLQVDNGTLYVDASDGRVGIGTTSPDAELDVNGSTILASGGTAIGKVLSASTSLNFLNTPAGSSQDLTMTVTGVDDGDPVFLGVPDGSVYPEVTFFAWVSAVNTVTIRLMNNSSVAVNPLNATYRVTVFQF